jgi:peptide chain release factor subunit 1
MRRLAEIESTQAPVLSVYLDVRPEAHGERPAERVAFTALRERLRGIEGTIEPGSPALDSFRSDVARLGELADDDAFRSAEGLAVFACSDAGLWETFSANVPFETEVSAGPTADLFQLARLLDEHTGAVVAVLDTNTLRLFVTRRGGLVERHGRDEPSEEHERHDQGGWSQARYQRHIDEQDRRFAKEAAEAITALVDRERATRLVLAGEERAMSVLMDALPERIKDLAAGVEHLPLRAGRDEVEAEIRPLLEQVDRDASTSVADRAIAGVRAGELGVAGVEPTMQALEAGQVHELVLLDGAEIDEDLRAELVRQAALTDARVEVVPEHEGLRRLGGVAATLRFRISPPDRASAPQS